VRVLGSPAGETPPTPIPSPLEHQPLREALARLRDPDAEPPTLRELGGHLFETLFPPPVRARLEASLGRVSADQGLCLRLRIDPPELWELPWEYIYDAQQTRDFLALSPRTVLERYVEQPQPAEPLEVSPPLRILVVISSPRDLPPLDAYAERRRIQKALDEVAAQGLVDISFLETATRRALQDELRRGYHIMHFIGHGAFRRSWGCLVLEDEEERRRLLDAEALGYLLKDTRVRLVVLNACSTAQIKDGNPFMAVAPALVRARVPAVIAMQFPIPDDTAAVFAQEFYRALSYAVQGEYYPIGVCLAEARKALMADFGIGEPDWGIPVLYTHAPDGVIFTPPRRRVGEEIKRRSGALQEWKEVHNLLQDLLTSFDSFHQRVLFLTDLNDGVRRQLQMDWDSCEWHILRLTRFASTLAYIDRPFREDAEGREGPLWLINLREHQALVKAALRGGTLQELRERVSDMGHHCKLYLIDADKALRTVATELCELSTRLPVRP